MGRRRERKGQEGKKTRGRGEREGYVIGRRQEVMIGRRRERGRVKRGRRRDEREGREGGKISSLGWIGRGMGKGLDKRGEGRR